jgi:hypothetical protein
MITVNDTKIADLQNQLAFAVTQKGPFWKREAVRLKAQIDSLA